VSHSVNSVTAPAAPAEAEAPAPSAADRANAIWGDAEQERAAIVEHDGGIPREWSEGFARLDPDRPLGDVPAARWRQFVDDVGHFLDHWAAHARALSWGPYDLFGCDRDRPFARINRNGLLWLLNGRHLVALSGDTAAIEDRSGVRQTWRRQPSKPSRVLVWELPN
jgi:hypothetical protein